MLIQSRRWLWVTLFAFAGAATVYSDGESPVKDAEALLQAVQKLQSDPAAGEGLQQSIGAKIEELKKAVDGSKATLAEIEARLPEIRKQLDEARGTQKVSEESLKIYEGIVELLATRKPAPAAAAPEAPASQAIPNPGLPRKTSPDSKISFNRDVRHILSNNCFACHGPDKNTRKANLRLDDETGALSDLGGGRFALVPGSIDQSELIKRILAEDPAERMPPVKSEKTLKPEEIETLRQWVADGAVYEKHWALIPPKRPEAPATARADWARNPIDQFLLARMEKDGLQPALEADKRTLIRRATLELTGLPPTPEEIAEYLNDSDADAYEQMLDRLFASPRHAEHMARGWLDAARYADTNGYHIDNERYMWPWRNWVIDAFSKNKRFDEFTIEQMAGDLLPNATLDQKVASGFNRNHMINFEGGAIPEEYLMNYNVDRVNTASTVWLGLTVGCAQCHDHKYDPVSQKEFYQLYSFFNQVPEEGLDGREGNAKPFMKVPSPGQTLLQQEYQAQIEDLKKKMHAALPLTDALQVKWEASQRAQLASRWSALTPEAMTSTGGATLTKQEDGSILATGANAEKDVYEITSTSPIANVSAIRLVALTDPSMTGNGPGRASNGNFVMSEFELEAAPVSDPSKKEPVKFIRAIADFSQDTFDIAQAIDGKAETGWAVAGYERHEERTALFLPERPIGFEGGTILTVRIRHESGITVHNIGRFILTVSDDPGLRPVTIDPWYINGPFKGADSGEAYLKDFGPEAQPVNLDETYPDGRLKWTPTFGFSDGKQHKLAGDVAATYLYRTINSPTDRTVKFLIGSNDGVKLWVNGEVIYGKNIGRKLTPDEDKPDVRLKAGLNHVLLKVVNHGSEYAFTFRKGDEALGTLPMNIELALSGDPAKRSAGQSEQVRDYYRAKFSPRWRAMNEELAKAVEENKKIEMSIPTTMVMQQVEKPMDTFVMVRGEYDKKGDKVEPLTPAALHPFPADQPKNRLGLAKWLVDPANPLTSRVTINRMWSRVFGYGLVKTVEDFGIQGEWPVHQELLDWLAVEFVESGWDMRHMLRLMMTSAAYRQSAAPGPNGYEIDPENRLIARGPRFRLDAEEIRDYALAVSGLLVEKVGGPSVKPYQPKGLWEEVAYGGKEFTGQEFVQDTGEKLYRRSMYTFLKRQAPPPGMAIFDAPSREICTVRRARTNTPLQALTLMNDIQFVEAARALAQRMMTQGGTKPEERVAFAFELATARKPTERECAILMGVYGKQLEKYNANNEEAVKLLSIGESKRDENINPAELAAWTCVANMILNLDETVTKG